MPLRSIERPVPPPIATILAPLLSFLLLYNFSKTEIFPFLLSISIMDNVVFCQPLKNMAEPIRINTAARKLDGSINAAFLINSRVRYIGLTLASTINPRTIIIEPKKISRNHLFTSRPGSSQPTSFVTFTLFLNLENIFNPPILKL